MADGDVPLPPGYDSYEEWSAMLTKVAQTKGAFVAKQPSIEFILKRVFQRFEAIPVRIDLQTEVISFLEAMKQERYRRVNRLVFSQKELEILNQNSFGTSHAIALATLNQQTRAEDIWELSQVQGRIQAIRDLQSELANGICNIPSEILLESGLSFAELEMNPALIEDNPVIQNWIQKEHKECGLLLQQLQAKSASYALATKIYLKFLTNSIQKHIQTLSDRE